MGMETKQITVDALLTIREVATLFQLKPGTVYQMVAQRKIPFLKVGPGGALVRFRREDVDAYQDAARVSAIR